MTPTLQPATPPPLPAVPAFLDLLHRGDGADALGQVADHMRRGGAVTEVVAELLAPAQRSVGEHWQAGRWSVADEHAASAVVEDTLGVLAAHVPRPAGSPRIALVCAEGEWHVTPARMAALLLRDAGWDVDFLGGSTPPTHVRAALERTRPHVLAISATLPLALAGVPAVVAAAHDAGVPVLAGGRAFGASDHRARRLGADGHAADASRAAALLTEWLDRPPTAVAVTPDPAWDRERTYLADHHAALLEETVGGLGGQVPEVGGYTPEQLDHTRRDLAFTLRFLETSLLVEDPGLFDEYTDWLRRLLAPRGVTAAVVARSLATLDRALAARDLTIARSLLRDHVDA